MTPNPILDAIQQSGIPVWVKDDKATEVWAGNIVRAFPHLDHVSEIAQAAGWWLENPGKVRGRRSCVGTIRNWLKRAHENRRVREGGMSASESKARADEWLRRAEQQAGG